MYIICGQYLIIQYLYYDDKCKESFTYLRRKLLKSGQTYNITGHVDEPQILTKCLTKDWTDLCVTNRSAWVSAEWQETHLTWILT